MIYLLWTLAYVGVIAISIQAIKFIINITKHYEWLKELKDGDKVNSTYWKVDRFESKIEYINNRLAELYRPVQLSPDSSTDCCKAAESKPVKKVIGRK